MKKFILLLFLSLIISQDSRTAYSVSGQVYLENIDDYSGVQISFYDLLQDPPVLFDFTLSDENGYYQIDLEAGYYLIEWTKDGYVPWEQGGFAHGSDIVLDDVELLSGDVITLTGEQSGNWTTAYQYWIEDDVVVPEGQTLTIDPGVRIKFYEDASLTCYGTLEANGTQSDPVLFTSKQPIPLPGDWDNIELHGINNVLSHVIYEYASDGITGGDASYSTFDYVFMDGATLPLYSNGIVLEGIEMSFTNNIINLPSGDNVAIEVTHSDYTDYDYVADECLFDESNSIFSDNNLTARIGIHSKNISYGNQYTNNTISATETGIKSTACRNCIFTANVIDNQLQNSGPNQGIEYDKQCIEYDCNYEWCIPDNSFMQIDGNTIISHNRGIWGKDGGDNNTITNNNITGFIRYAGIYSSPEAEITDNHIERTETLGSQYETLLYARNSTISNNTIIDYPSYSKRSSLFSAIYSENCLIEHNNIEFYIGEDGWCTNMYVIHDHNSTIRNNNFDIKENGTWCGEWRIISSHGSSQREISGNSISIVDEGTRGYDADIDWAIYVDDNVTIFNNSVISEAGYSIANLIRLGSGNQVYNNTFDIDLMEYPGWYNILSGSLFHFNGSDNEFHNNNISVNHAGTAFNIFGNDNKIYENNIISYADGSSFCTYGNCSYKGLSKAFVLNNGSSDNEIYQNNFYGISDNASVIDQSSASIHHNLFDIDIESVSGISISNYSEVDLYNNTFAGAGGGTGLTSSQSTVSIINNIFSDFETGVDYNSDLPNSQIRFNDVSSISNQAYSGTGLPVMIGSYVNEVLTFAGDTVLTDIYGNMNANPEFGMPSENNFELQLISPCINNGDPSLELDPDGTISDIGAFYKDNFIVEDVYGCTDEGACNFNPQANLDNGDCNYPSIWYLDEDGDGLGWSDDSIESCDIPNGYVANGDDLEPDCATNDTDDCGVCAGENLDQDCQGICFGQALIDDCGVCSGGDTGHDFNSDIDCNGDCFGDAYLDGCSQCVGGNTGDEECPQDCNGVYNGDAFWDDCGICSGGDTDHVANSDQDCAGVCFGDSVSDSFEGCCMTSDIDSCGQCNGNGWDMCDEDGDGTSNFEQWGYGAYNISIVDVLNDQGGWVNISFENSFFDTDTLRSESYTIEANYGEGWIVSASGGAYGSDSYIYQVHTQVDSTASSDGMIDFRIIASMDEGNFVSSTVSGYSVDNIVPLVPANLAATLEDQFILLSWDNNTDIDLGSYNIYRDNELISSSDQSLFLDETVEMAQEYQYAVSAVDIHDNESNLSDSITINTDLAGDINYDGIVNIYDVIIVISCVLDDDCDILYDINLDGTVNIYDIIQLVNIILA